MKLTYIACLGTAVVLGVVLFAAKSANSDSPAASNASPPAQPAAPVPQTQVFFMPPEGMKFVNYREGNEVLQRARTALAEGDPKAALVLIEEAERKHATAGHVLAERETEPTAPPVAESSSGVVAQLANPAPRSPQQVAASRLDGEGRRLLLSGDAAGTLAKFDEAGRVDPTRFPRWDEYAEAYRALGRDAEELDALLKTLDTFGGRVASTMHEEGWRGSRALELGDRLGRDVLPQLDLDRLTVERVTGPKVSVRTMLDEGWTTRDALDLDRVSYLLSHERYAEAETWATTLIARTQSAEAYYLRYEARLHLRPKDMSIRDDAKQAYARSTGALRKYIVWMRGAHVVRDWPQSPEELEHP